jgi:hypothetical protein
MYYFHENLWFFAASLGAQPALVQTAMKPHFTAVER